MGAIIVYIIKSGIALMLFYIFYKILVSNNTFYRFNRIVLLGIVLLSALIPLYIPVLKIEKETATVTTLALPLKEQGENITIPVSHNYISENIIPVSQQKTTGSIFWFFIGIFYLSGCLFFLLYTLFSFYKLYRLIKSSDKVATKTNTHLLITQKDIAPFSWMNYIIISRQNWLEYGETIFLHEQGHIHCKHSWDLLFMQFFVILNWFNPAAWLVKQQLQNIHEFEADEYVLKQGVNAKQYQLLLIKKAVGTQRFISMANSFNHSKLKKRIRMMLKDKSRPWTCVKYLYIVPVSLLVITAFARPEIATEMKKISDVKIPAIRWTEKVENHPVDETAVELVSFITPEVSDFIEEYRRTSLLQQEEQEVVNEQSDGREVEEIPVVSMVQDSLVVNVNNHTHELQAENPTQMIDSVTTNTLIGEKININLSTGYFKGYNLKGSLNSTLEIRKPVEENPSLLLVDGKEYPESYLSELDPQTIQSFTILKDQASMESYGRNGVIIVTTKKQNKHFITQRNVLIADKIELTDVNGNLKYLPDEKIGAIVNEVQDNGLSNVFIDYLINPELEKYMNGQMWMSSNVRLIVNGEDVSSKLIKPIPGDQIETIELIPTNSEETLETGVFHITTK